MTVGDVLILPGVRQLGDFFKEHPVTLFDPAFAGLQVAHHAGEILPAAEIGDRYCLRVVLEPEGIRPRPAGHKSFNDATERPHGAIRHSRQHDGRRQAEEECEPGDGHEVSCGINDD